MPAEMVCVCVSICARRNTRDRWRAKNLRVPPHYSESRCYFASKTLHALLEGLFLRSVWFVTRGGRRPWLYSAAAMRLMMRAERAHEIAATRLENTLRALPLLSYEQHHRGGNIPDAQASPRENFAHKHLPNVKKVLLLL